MSNLVGVLPELAAAELKLRQLAAARGIAYTIADFGGVRSEADTTRILGYRDVEYAAYVAALKKRAPNAVPVPKLEWRPIAPFGTSYHNFGAAFDVSIAAHPLASDAAALAALGALAPSCGLRWGGNFPSRRRDTPHFELAIPLTEARDRWLARGRAPGEAPAVIAVRPPEVGAVDSITLGAMVVIGVLGAILARGLRSW